MIFQFLGVLELSLEVVIFGLQRAQLCQRGDRVVELFDEVLGLASEKESFGVVRGHVHDLVSNGDHRLIFLHLEFADDKVREAGKLELVQLVHRCFKLLRVFILFLEVVRDVAEVKVAIDFLVDFGSFGTVSFFEELTRCCLDPLQDSQLIGRRVLVKVRSVFNAKE